MLLPLLGKPVILYSIEAFRNAGVCDIIITAGENNHESISSLTAGIAGVRARVVIGGSTRGESALRGINAVSQSFGIAAVHDGARPLVTPRLIKEVTAAAEKFGAAIAAVKIRDTVKKEAGGFVAATLDRETLYSAQTPQAFDLRLYREAAASVSDFGQLTDDSMLFEKIGVKVRVVPGDYSNIKITSPEDMIIAEGLLKSGTY